jgi:hypothetical protein
MSSNSRINFAMTPPVDEPGQRATIALEIFTNACEPFGLRRSDQAPAAISASAVQ